MDYVYSQIANLHQFIWNVGKNWGKWCHTIFPLYFKTENQDGKGKRLLKRNTHPHAFYSQGGFKHDVSMVPWNTCMINWASIFFTLRLLNQAEIPHYVHSYFQRKIWQVKGSETASVHNYVISSIFINLIEQKRNKKQQQKQQQKWHMQSPQQQATDLNSTKLAHPHNSLDDKWHKYGNAHGILGAIQINKLNTKYILKSIKATT